MSNLASLRRQYEYLKPFERAVMLQEAASRLDEHLAEALTAPSVWDAYRVACFGRAFVFITFAAIQESQKGDTLFWLASAMLSAKQNRKNESAESLNEWKEKQAEGQRRRLSWFLALQALEAETGAAFMVTARLFANGYVERLSVLQTFVPKDKPIPYAEELAHLREAWNLSAKG